MSFTPVIPTTYTSNRQDLCDGLAALVDAFIVSEDHEIGRMFLDEIPDSFTAEGPLIVIGEITEEVVHDAQTRTTTFRGALFFFDTFPDHGEYRRRVNAFADHMRDLFTENPRLINPAAGELYQIAFQEDERTQGRLTFGAPHIDWIYRIQEGYR